MGLIGRRALFRLLGLALFIPMAGVGYAVGGEPFRLRVQRHSVSPPGWPTDLSLRVAVIADIHACEPWMPVDRVRLIVDRANALEPDLILLLGDYGLSIHFGARSIPAREWARALGDLRASLGVHAVLGNHDWLEDLDAMARGHGPVRNGAALVEVGIPVYENDVRRLEKDGRAFWLAGLGDQLARVSPRRGARRGVDDLPGTLAKITDDAPVLLMAHEPDIFPEVPARVALTLCGHTHGGQVRLFGWAPAVPSIHGDRYAYGHIVEPDADGRPRDLVVSGGIGCTHVPIRFGVPPEITLVELGGATA